MRRALQLGWLMAILGLVAMADSFVRMVHISYLHAPAEVSRRPGSSAAGTWTTALRNAPLEEGEQVRTGAGGEVEVFLECGSALRLIPNSTLSLVRLRRSEDGIADTVVRVDRGTAFFTLRKNDERKLAIEVANGQLGGWHGTTQIRVNVTAADAAVELLGGRASLTLSGQAYPLPQSRKLSWPAHGSTPVEAAAWPKDEWFRWDQQRDQLFNRELFSSRRLESDPMSPAVDGSTESGQNMGAGPGMAGANAGLLQPGLSPLGSDELRQAMADSSARPVSRAAPSLPRCAIY